MSEPASLIVQCRIAPEGLRQSLAARAPRASGWGDWAALGLTLSAAEIADLDLQTGASTGDFLRRLRASAERPADWICAYDADEQMLTIAQVLFSENWLSIVAALTVLRRLGNAMTQSHQQGIILVQDWIFAQRGTMAAVSLFAQGSEILAPDGMAPDSLAAEAGRRAKAVLTPLRDRIAAGAPGPARDDLDMLIGWP